MYSKHKSVSTNLNYQWKYSRFSKCHYGQVLSLIVPSSNASKIKNSMLCVARKPCVYPVMPLLCFSRKHAMLLCIQLNFQCGKGKVENIGMFNKENSLSVKIQLWPVLCSAASHFSHLESFILHLSLAATADEL